ncbi:MAG: hypothetical protein M3R13_05595 [Armatimonadota bacterium]|nr:hypothetical protein [Armatimonadota bacterium]
MLGCLRSFSRTLEICFLTGVGTAFESTRDLGARQSVDETQPYEPFVVVTQARKSEGQWGAHPCFGGKVVVLVVPTRLRKSRLPTVLSHGIEGKPADPSIQSTPARVKLSGMAQHFQRACLCKIVDVARRYSVALDPPPHGGKNVAGE